MKFNTSFQLNTYQALCNAKGALERTILGQIRDTGIGIFRWDWLLIEKLGSILTDVK